MAQTLNIYSKFLNSLTFKEVNLNTDELKIMLLSSAYTPNVDTQQYKSDITGEVTGAGYTAGGETLTNIQFTIINKVATLSADNPSWSDINVDNLRYAVLYDNAPLQDSQKPLIAYIDFGESLSIANAIFEIIWNAEGIFKISIRV